MNEWKENTGVVPEGVTAETAIEVQYACGIVLWWLPTNKDAVNDDPELWAIDGTSFDVVRWRFLDDQ